MSRKDAVVVASRTLSVLLTVWALTDVSYLPEYVHSYLHYASEGTSSSAYTQYMHHYYLLRLGFLLTRIVGYILLATWLHKGGPSVDELLSPHEGEDISVKNG